MVAWCDASVYLTFCWLTMGHRSRIPGWWLHSTNMCQCQLNEASHLFILVVVSLSLVDFVAPFKAKRIWHKRTPDPQTITILDALLCALTALLKVDLNNIKCCYTSNVVKSTSQWVTSAWREMWSYFLHCHAQIVRHPTSHHTVRLTTHNFMSFYKKHCTSRVLLVFIICLKNSHSSTFYSQIVWHLQLNIDWQLSNLQQGLFRLCLNLKSDCPISQPRVRLPTYSTVSAEMAMTRISRKVLAAW